MSDSLPRYERPKEVPPTPVPLDPSTLIPVAALEDALAASALSEGGKALARGLIRLGRPAVFGGGGAGIEYGSLLKTAARPDYIAAHVREAAEHLHARQVDLLMVPGMSGYPVGAMYSVVAGVPAVLLKKQRYEQRPGGEEPEGGYPPGAFVIPSYTGDADVLISADLTSVQDIVNTVLRGQLDAQAGHERLAFSLRVAGADDIIDKATMSQAVSDSALIVGKAAIRSFVERYRADSGDARPVSDSVEVVAWVTPLIKGYNRPHEQLQRWFGITPFAGINVTSVHLDPPAIGIEGLGVVAFS
ncbi:MAG TPA: hypothetical protein VNP95_01380 [Thermomicrobiales bacterium]|nr:hypothetical protein [Thermomicrobiales bacterium]